MRIIPKHQTARYFIEPLDRRILLSVDLVADINQTASNEFKPAGLTVLNGVAYYAHADGLSGIELWRSDGTEQGTWRVKDIAEGPADSSPQNLVAAGGLLYFSANDGVHGAELWRTDGTSAGTFLVKDINTGSAASSPASFCLLNGKVFFSATSAATGRELWATDGTAGNVELIADIRPGTSNSSPQNITALGNVIYFSALLPTVGVELFRSEGTAATTQLLLDINQGAESSFPADFAQTNGVLCFTIQNDQFSNEKLMWRTDGTTAGTFSVLAPGSKYQPINKVITSGGRVYFPRNSQLWRSDGTLTGTQLVSSVTGSLSSLESVNLADAGDGLYVSTTAPNANKRIWKVGPTGTAVQLASIADVALIDSFATAGSRLYFRLQKFDSVRELYTSDGTVSGTGRLLGIEPGIGTSSPAEMVALNNSTLAFVATTPSTATEIWRSDGTSAGTVLVADSFRGTVGSGAHVLGQVGSKLVLSASDAVFGEELWVSDGTAAGTTLLKDLNPTGSSELSQIFGHTGGSFVLFTAKTPTTGTELWCTDGTPSGTFLLADVLPGADDSIVNSYVAFGGAHYFTVFNFSTDESTVWKTDGTVAGTVANPLSAVGLRKVHLLTSLNGSMYLSATTSSTSGRGLWRSNGTAGGTSLVKEISQGFAANQAWEVLVNAGRMYISATNLSQGRELWISDGTNAGTTMLADLVPGVDSSSPSYLTAAGSRVYFSATTTTTGRELFVTDGTTVGTRLAADVYPGSASSNATPMAALGERLLFNALTPEFGTELWSIQPEQPATLLRDIFPGTTSSMTFPNSTTYRGLILFRADDGSHGRELWATDGTTSGTMLIADISGGQRAGDPLSFFVTGQELYLRAEGSLSGNELHVLHDTAGPQVTVASFDPDAGPAALLDFDEAIYGGLSLSDVQVTNRDTATVVPDAIVAIDTLRVVPPRYRIEILPTLSDGDYRLTVPAAELRDAFGQFSTAGVTLDFFILAGDANRDRAVNISDFSILASRFNLPGTFSQGDFNYDGVTNISDFAILASKFNTTLPAARGAATSVGMGVFGRVTHIDREMDELDAIRSQVL